jgi:hypothetical protein
MDDELEYIFREADVVQFKTLSRYSHGMTEGNHENPIRIVGIGP